MKRLRNSKPVVTQTPDHHRKQSTQNKNARWAWTHTAKYMPHLEEKLLSRNDITLFLATIHPEKKDS